MALSDHCVSFVLCAVSTNSEVCAAVGREAAPSFFLFVYSSVFSIVYMYELHVSNCYSNTGLRLMTNTLARVLGKIVFAGFITIVVLTFYSVVGSQLFGGSFNYRCFDKTTAVAQSIPVFLESTSTRVLGPLCSQGSGGLKCPTSQFCASANQVLEMKISGSNLSRFICAVFCAGP